ncbi:hypothetical protein SMC26_00665 [Actinomadura fulvescens]|uniref:Uncharacterized protein n=1 Tax=Actinomadura fulvescens TaxID=46160 RepID=A0ABP6C4E1_9ACTN
MKSIAKAVTFSLGLTVAGGLMAAAPATAATASSAKASATSETAAKPRTVYKRKYHAGNKYGDARGTLAITYDRGSYRHPLRLHVSGKLRDFCSTKSASHVYLSWSQGPKGQVKRKNVRVASVGNCKSVNFRKSYSTGIYMPSKAYVTVCSSVKKRWYCGRPG